MALNTNNCNQATTIIRADEGCQQNLPACAWHIRFPLRSPHFIFTYSVLLLAWRICQKPPTATLRNVSSPSLLTLATCVGAVSIIYLAVCRTFYLFFLCGDILANDFFIPKFKKKIDSENINLGRTCVNETSVQKWHCDLPCFLMCIFFSWVRWWLSQMMCFSMRLLKAKSVVNVRISKTTGDIRNNQIESCI